MWRTGWLSKPCPHPACFCMEPMFWAQVLSKPSMLCKHQAPTKDDGGRLASRTPQVPAPLAGFSDSASGACGHHSSPAPKELREDSVGGGGPGAWCWSFLPGTGWQSHSSPLIVIDFSCPSSSTSTRSCPFSMILWGMAQFTQRAMHTNPAGACLHAGMPWRTGQILPTGS